MLRYYKILNEINKRPTTNRPSKKDSWDKIDIVLKSIGSFLTALSVACLGFFGSQYLAHKQESETNTRLYTELMSKREEADNSLRKDMFNSFIANFLKPEPTANLEHKVLNVELLSLNFHESIDFAPLFNNVRQQVIESQNIDENKKDKLLTRLVKVAKDIVSKQISTLVEGGGKIDTTVDLDTLLNSFKGLTVIEDSVKIIPAIGKDTVIWKVNVEALRTDTAKKEIQIRLEVKENFNIITDVKFWVGFFNFPMINNFRLPKGQRCAIALKVYEGSTAEITFLYFPGSRASLKDKPYYDEIIYNLINAQDYLHEEYKK